MSDCHLSSPTQCRSRRVYANGNQISTSVNPDTASYAVILTPFGILFRVYVKAPICALNSRYAGMNAFAVFALHFKCSSNKLNLRLNSKKNRFIGINQAIEHHLVARFVNSRNFSAVPMIISCTRNRRLPLFSQLKMEFSVEIRPSQGAIYHWVTALPYFSHCSGRPRSPSRLTQTGGIGHAYIVQMGTSKRAGCFTRCSLPACAHEF